MVVGGWLPWSLRYYPQWFVVEFGVFRFCSEFVPNFPNFYVKFHWLWGEKNKINTLNFQNSNIRIADLPMLEEMALLVYPQRSSFRRASLPPAHGRWIEAEKPAHRKLPNRYQTWTYRSDSSRIVNIMASSARYAFERARYCGFGVWNSILDFPIFFGRNSEKFGSVVNNSFRISKSIVYGKIVRCGFRCVWRLQKRIDIFC